MAKNSEVYKTAQERAEAFERFCYSCFNCPIPEELKDKDYKCAFAWLDLECYEEKPLPCPFCGGKINIYHCGDNGKKSFGLACFCGYRIRAKSESDIANKIADHNRVAKKCRESEGK